MFADQRNMVELINSALPAAVRAPDECVFALEMAIYQQANTRPANYRRSASPVRTYN